MHDLLSTCIFCWSHKQFALPTTNMALTNISFLVIVVVFAAVCIEHSRAGYCTETSTCYNTCYKRKCSGWWRRRCSSVSYSCPKTCYKKVCCKGYTGTNCAEDIDECTLGIDRCQHVCANTVGSYTCSCDSGFILQPDKCTCKGHWCQESYSCTSTCYKKTSSGGSWWRRTKYSQSSYSCPATCHRPACCSGWSGSECSIPDERVFA